MSCRISSTASTALTPPVPNNPSLAMAWASPSPKNWPKTSVAKLKLRAFQKKVAILHWWWGWSSRALFRRRWGLSLLLAALLRLIAAFSGFRQAWGFGGSGAEAANRIRKVLGHDIVVGFDFFAV